jgi:diaminopimelate decarboxylase
MLKLDGDHYTIGGIDALDLCRKYDTPLYVYDTAVMEKQYKLLKGSFKGFEPKNGNFACKALNNINILRFFSDWVPVWTVCRYRRCGSGSKQGSNHLRSCTRPTVSLWRR